MNLLLHVLQIYHALQILGHSQSCILRHLHPFEAYPLDHHMARTRADTRVIKRREIMAIDVACRAHTSKELAERIRPYLYTRLQQNYSIRW